MAYSLKLAAAAARERWQSCNLLVLDEAVAGMPRAGYQAPQGSPAHAGMSYRKLLSWCTCQHTYRSAFLPSAAIASVDIVASNSQKGINTGCSLCSLPSRLLACSLKQLSRWYCLNAARACCGVTANGRSTGAAWPDLVAAIQQQPHSTQAKVMYVSEQLAAGMCTV